MTEPHPVDAPIAVRHPWAEAALEVKDGAEVRVLEPSPPADTTDEAYLADDPLKVDGTSATTVWPVDGRGRTWDEVARAEGADPDLAAFCRQRWLGPRRELPPVPDGFAEARLAFHRLAVYVVSPARREANGKIGLRQTFGGFGTPFFATPEGDRQVRVQGTALVVQEAVDAVRAAPITTLAAAAEHVGVTLDLEAAATFDVPEPGKPSAPLPVTRDAAAFLADWYGFASSLLEQVRAEHSSPAAPSRVQLWPEHFDLAFELGDDSRCRRAGFGASPGDAYSEDPYLYVTLWRCGDRRPDPETARLFEDRFWNAPFGASLPLRAFAGPDERETALQFFRAAAERLA